MVRIVQHFYSGLRIEARSRSKDALQEGFKARVADPLWMLARQWQLGELTGEDSGSAVNVKVDYYTQEIKALEEEQTAPLETLVEREPFKLDIRTRMQIGQQFERIYKLVAQEQGDAESISRVLCELKNKQSAYGFKLPKDKENFQMLDYASQRLLKAISGRVIDGEKLFSLQSDLREQASGTVGLALDKLNAWFKDVYNIDLEKMNPYWKPEQLEYEFSLQGKAEAGAAELTAPSYRSSDLDWYSCDIKTQPQQTEETLIKTEEFTPTRVGFAGKPNERWWALEDHRVNLGKLKPNTTELGKLLLSEFALLYADDWLIVPLTIPRANGTLTKITKLDIIDSFGEVFTINPAIESAPAESQEWGMFILEPIDDEQVEESCLFIPPTIGKREESQALEEVRFIRDENANMVFAVEQTIRNGIGKPVRGFEAQLEKYERMNKVDGTIPGEIEEQDQNSETNISKYKLASPVPDNWIPYIYRRVNSETIRLRRSNMLRNTSQDERITAMSNIIRGNGNNDTGIKWLNEECISRSGINVVISIQRARMPNGKTSIWYGKKIVNSCYVSKMQLMCDYLDLG